MNREVTWAHVLSRPLWDVVIVGGGITGAGIFRETTQLGLRSVLLEQNDFSWGASSRSGKLVHGGLRYLRQGDIRLTWESAREREKLLRRMPGLVKPVGFLLPVYTPLERVMLGLGLTAYDACVKQRRHHYLPAEEFVWLAPSIRQEGLRGGFRYQEACTDDARLVLRLIREGQRAGGEVLNYASVLALLRCRNGRVKGVVVQDAVSGKTASIQAHVVVNATGAWADRLRGELGKSPRMRPLRGTHLLFPQWRFPLAQAIGFFHPKDGRPLYALPWNNATLVGTTDVDHAAGLDEEPRPTLPEVEYLLTALRHMFPVLELGREDILATFAGVRPVVSHGKANPSRESREHVVWSEEGLVTVTGGKLTTFRLLAQAAMHALRPFLTASAPPEHGLEPPAAAPWPSDIDEWVGRWERDWLVGRYGAEATIMVSKIPSNVWGHIGNTPYLWGEVLWALQQEMVVHLDDLLLRRVRAGMLLPDGGLSLLPRLRPWCRQWLGWDLSRWEEEVKRYRHILQTVYRPNQLSKKSPSGRQA